MMHGPVNIKCTGKDARRKRESNSIPVFRWPMPTHSVASIGDPLKLSDRFFRVFFLL